MQDFFRCNFQMIVLTLPILIPCHPSPPPHPLPPERFCPGRFTSVLPLHCSSYINFHCISKKVRGVYHACYHLPLLNSLPSKLSTLYSFYTTFFFREDNVGDSLILHCFKNNNKSWTHCIQVSIIMHLSKNLHLILASYLTLCLFLALNIFEYVK